ncbi:M23 family metallopeptidase [Seonamhaeicola sp. ML3]|uniref:M23 family metallopeptidase n=1 Tax=Seonamhaeicola sp. ML3 TaxID=2937786 RepID=UPI00353165B4
MSNTQNNYPQDYFRSPLDIPLILSGTFAELRSNHFHSGIDLKTQQRVGLNVKACADGFVSRIKISNYGYGKAIYVTHPNGYTTVYAHLQKFEPEIEAYIKQQQYKKESYEIELFPSADTLPIKKGQLIAYSGNSGGSGGPHLHFEIRDNAQRPVNPMLFGIDIADTKKPFVKSLYAYPLDNNTFVNNSNEKQKLRLIPIEGGNYVVESIKAIGNIGFGIETNDRQNLASNSNGVYNIQSFVNGNKNFELDFKRFAFSETKHINQLIDYEHYAKKKQRIQKLYRVNNPLSIYKSVLDEGVVSIKDSAYVVYKIRITDFKDNETWVTLNVKGTKKAVAKAKQPKTTPYYINVNQDINLKKDNVTVDFYKDTFYEDFYLNFEVSNDTLTLHKDVKAAKKSFNISYDISKYNAKDKSSLYIARLLGYNKYPSYTSTKREGDLLKARTKTLGTFALALDTINPTIKPVNFKNGQWLSKYRYLKIKIDDKESGVSKYRATINGKWILMERNNYTDNTITFDFNDGIVTDTKNILKVIVTDNVGNNSTFEALFYRK